MVSYGKQEIYRLLSEKGVWHEITEHKAVYNMDEVADIELPYPCLYEIKRKGNTT